MPLSTTLQQILFPVFRTAVRPLVGHGWGGLRPLNATYKLFARTLLPGSQQIVKVNNYLFRATAVPGETLDSVTHRLILKRSYEPLTTAIFKQILKRGMKVIDVGANIGYYSILAARLVGETGKVWAFEPDPQNYSRLLDNIRLNHLNNIEPISKAVTAEVGTANLYRSDTDSGKHSLIKLLSSQRPPLTVETVNLDSVFPDIQADVIKIDTEGSDIEVLRGAKNLIAANESITLITEFWPYGLTAAGHQPAELWALLSDYGFKHIYIIDERKKTVIPGDLKVALQAGKKREHSINLVCLKDTEMETVPYMSLRTLSRT